MPFCTAKVCRINLSQDTSGSWVLDIGSVCVFASGVADSLSSVWDVLGLYGSVLKKTGP